MGFSRPGPSLLHIIHQTSPWVSVSHESKHQQKSKTKLPWVISNRLKTTSFLRKLDHKKVFPGQVCKKNTQVSSFDQHILKRRISNPSSFILNGEFQPGWGARHSSQAHGAEAILDPTNLEFQVEIQLEFQFQRSLEFQFQQGGRVFLYQNISCTTFRARSTENQLWTKPSNSASARFGWFSPKMFLLSVSQKFEAHTGFP